jgi:hypothetical protein
MGSGEGDCVLDVGDGEDGRTWIVSRTGSGIASWMSSGEVGRVGEVRDVEDVGDEAGIFLGFLVKKPLIPSCDLSFLGNESFVFINHSVLEWWLRGEFPNFPQLNFSSFHHFYCETVLWP